MNLKADRAGEVGESQEASPSCPKEAYLATKTSDKSSHLGIWARPEICSVLIKPALLLAETPRSSRHKAQTRIDPPIKLNNPFQIQNQSPLAHHQISKITSYLVTFVWNIKFWAKISIAIYDMYVQYRAEVSQRRVS